MTRANDFRRFGLAFTGTRPKLRLGDPGIDGAWLRRYRFGRVLNIGWFGLTPMLFAGGLITAWGPFGRLDTWQLDTFGSNNVILLTILFTPVAFVPLAVAHLARVDASTPVLLGIRQSLDDKWGPRVEDGRGDRRARLLRDVRWAQGMAAVGAAAFAFFAWKGFRDAAMPHPPLPEWSYARLVDPAVPLPHALRLTGAVADRTREWTHAYSVRQDSYRDTYYALRLAGAATGNPVALVELDPTNPQYGPAIWNEVDPPGPREGSPAPIDDWTAQQLRAAGLVLAPRVVVLTRRHLEGRDPDPDPIEDEFHAMLGFSLLFAGIVSWWKGSRVMKQLPRTVAD